MQITISASIGFSYLFMTSCLKSKHKNTLSELETFLTNIDILSSGLQPVGMNSLLHFLGLTVLLQIYYEEPVLHFLRYNSTSSIRDRNKIYNLIYKKFILFTSNPSD